MKKSLLSIAIIAAMPFAANATDPVVAVGPAHASSNPVVATANAPYVTITPSQADESHIATTAYVKGAYNDAIAAVNKVDSDKQGKLMNMESTPQPISNNVVSSSTLTGLGAGIASWFSDDDYATFLPDVESAIGADVDETLPTTGLVVDLIYGASTTLNNRIDEKQNKLTLVDGNDVSDNDDIHVYNNAELIYNLFSYPLSNADLVEAANAPNFDKYLITAGAVLGAMAAQRVDIYTTWDTNATTPVAFSTAAQSVQN